MSVCFLAILELFFTVSLSHRFYSTSSPSIMESSNHRSPRLDCCRFDDDDDSSLFCLFLSFFNMFSVKDQSKRKGQSTTIGKINQHLRSIDTDLHSPPRSSRGRQERSDKRFLGINRGGTPSFLAFLDDCEILFTSSQSIQLFTSK